MRKASFFKKGKKGFLKIFWLLIFWLVALLGLLFSDFFKIKNVSFSQESFTCGVAEEVRAAVNLEGRNYFLIDLTEIENKIAQKFPCIAKIELKKTLPGKIKMVLHPRQSAAIISLISAKSSLDLNLKEASVSTEAASLNFSVSAGAVRFLADQSGFVFSQTSSLDNLPVIYLADEVSVGQVVKNNVVKKVIELLELLKSFSNLPRTIKVINDQILVDGDVQIAISLKKDYYRQLASLQLILEKAKMNSKRMERIDLRFDKPIIIYSSNK